MEYTNLGRTDLKVSRTSLGALPIQRVDFETARKIFRKAYENEINFFDTARGYSDSESKIGYSLADIRKNIYIATKTPARDKKNLFRDLETSLSNMKTDYVDLLQLHNPGDVPDRDDPDGSYAGLAEAKKKGLVRFIGITLHSYEAAMKAADSNLFDTIQFPFSCLSDEREIALVNKCNEKNIGFIAMKAMAGGLIENVEANFCFLRQFGNVVPIWGIQRESELDQFLSLEKNPPLMDDAMKKAIEAEKNSLGGKFCRGCGYCKPCPVNLPLDMMCRMDKLLTRAVYQNFITEEWQKHMADTEKCTMCKACAKRCPYGLKPYELIKSQYEFFKDFVKIHIE